MNERIEKLAREAALAEGWGPGVWQTTFTEKFAELIVKECAGIAKHNVMNISTYADAEFVDEQIMKHFGVEEQEKVASKPECSVCGTTENVKYMGGYQPYLCDSVDCIPF